MNACATFNQDVRGTARALQEVTADAARHIVCFITQAVRQQVDRRNHASLSLIKEVLNVLSVYLIGDAIHGVNTGIVRALGKQFKASVATLICYYAIGMPLALVLGFKHEMGLVGFWLGFMIAMFLLDFVVIFIIVTADWEIGTKNDETSLRLTRQNSFISVGSESTTKNVLPMEPMLLLTRQSSYVSVGSSASKRLRKGDSSTKKAPSMT